MMGASNRREWTRATGIRLLILAVSIPALLFVVTAFRVANTASLEEIHPADALVVFGAAEYSGRPSPVLKARLDHAFDLYERHIAPVVITTGGAAADPKFSEGGVGKDYLRHRGIPENALIAETQGSDTAKSAQRVAGILHANNMSSCVAVSDAYHVFRIRKMLEHEGIQVYVAPRPESRPHTRWARAEAVSRESLSYLLWKLGIG